MNPAPPCASCASWCWSGWCTLDCDQQAPLADITAHDDRSWPSSRSTSPAPKPAPSSMRCTARRSGPMAAAAQLWVVGMGKLGARELNVSSDIDLIYVYDQDGETAGNATAAAASANQEYFAKAVKRIYALVGDTTEHGFVFRVDLALRPNGNSGPPAVSLDALEEYFQVQGREWERFAWLKSRVVAPGDTHRRRLGAGAARRGAALRVPPLPRLQRVRFAARAAPADPRAGGAPQRRPARARQRRQAVARRHPRDRVHRAAAAGGARRPVPRAAHPAHAGGAAAPGRAPA